jgi:CRP/FNR family transcriptional regulator, cyclic AMP receptor protein
MTVSISLSAHYCFRTLEADACRRLDQQCLWLRAYAGSRVVDELADERDVYFVFSGRLRAVLHGARQDVSFTEIDAGSFFGEMSALDGAPRSVSILAVTDAQLARMPGAIFRETLFLHRPLCEAVLTTLTNRLRVMTSRVRQFGALDARRRVCAELLRLAQPDRDAPGRARIASPPNQTELAARIDACRETVSRELNAMERGGLIERRRGVIVILDAARLASTIGAAYDR